jgi:ATP-dependent helicase HrpA
MALPILDRKDEILAALGDHQVVIVAGETGSGKSTQLPQYLLEAGLGADGRLIGHTQPRRLAARTVAERIAEELGTEVGGLVGYTVRFTDKVRPATRIKVMTDGILLNELQRDRKLSRYDCLIVDEAHERSLNIDFILGYLEQLLPQRPDMKVIVTSATIDTARFSAHFHHAPIVEVSGRTYPVEIRYRPIDDDSDQTQAIVEAVDELRVEGPGDILVFLSGEREIRDTADALNRLELRNTEVVPLFARLSSTDQHRVFEPHTGRRIVLATNVAETSLTVPGIHYVIDPGNARISRYNRRTKVQRLPIEAISRASADQRAGRCGRIAPGTCIRLYEEDDFAARPEFTEPEILRTNLASVILQMTAIGLGDIAAFPFVDPPDNRSIKDGIALLEELGALVAESEGTTRSLTSMGRRLAQLPVDPRLGRMVLEAERNDCVDEVMVIAAALSIQDPRERPAERQQEAAELHRRFADESSDFISILNLWRYLQDQQAALTRNQFRRLCKAEHLHHLRVREWQDIHGQLRQVVRGMRIHIGASDEIDRDRIHQSLLAGLLSHIGARDAERNEFTGARGARFAIAPGSVLFRKPPRWVMAAELVETNRLWGRVAARIQPEWAERLAAHLVTRSYSEPWWDAARGAAMATERVSLYGLPIVANRRVQYGRIDPDAARQLFIRCALVDGDWETHHAFVEENARLAAEVRALEDRVRRHDILVDDETLYDFFDERIPRHVISARHFDRWWRDKPVSLTFTRDLLIERDIDPTGFPDTLNGLPLTYVFEPTAELDGVTVDIPLARLNDVGSGFDWQVPGLREDLVTALLRSLPKQHRRNLVPAPEHARAFLRATHDGPLLDALSRHFGVDRDAWDLDSIPDHLLMTFRVLDEHGRPLAWSKDLAALRRHLQEMLRTTITGAGAYVERSGLTAWTIGDLPRSIEGDVGGHPIIAYPSLVDEGSTVGVRSFATAQEQAAAMPLGLRRLLRLTVKLPKADGDVVDAALDALVRPVWSEAEWDALRARAQERLPSMTAAIGRSVQRIEQLVMQVELRMKAAPLHVLEDVATQLGRLVRPGFATAVGARRLADIERYLQAIVVRLDAAPKNPARDRALMERVNRLEGMTDDSAIRWMIEELRVSLFAQALGTKQKVSETRILREIAGR